MYDVERSGDTERIRIRGSEQLFRLVVVLVGVDGWVMRLTSVLQMR